MKYFFLAFLFVSIRSFSQECNLHQEKDLITGAPKTSTGFFELQGTTLSIDADSKTIDFFFTVGSEGKCFDYESTAVITFEGGRLKTTMKNSGTVNCEGYFHFSFRNSAGTPAMLTNLSTKKVVNIKFSGTNKTETSIAPTDEEQQKLMDITTCIINESKKLLQAN